MSSIIEVLSTYTMGLLNILGHDGYAFSMDHTQVGIFQEADQVLLCSIPQSQHHTYLEVHIILPYFLDNFMDQR